MSQNFPNNKNTNMSFFAWALRNDSATVANEVLECVTEECKIQLAALLALAED